MLPTLGAALTDTACFDRAVEVEASSAWGETAARDRVNARPLQEDGMARNSIGGHASARAAAAIPAERVWWVCAPSEAHLSIVLHGMGVHGGDTGLVLRTRHRDV